jgi:hypothetical protein
LKVREDIEPRDRYIRLGDSGAEEGEEGTPITISDVLLEI